MTHIDALHLLGAIKDANYKLTERENSICKMIIVFIQRNRPLSSKQSWSLQEIYRRSQKHYEKLYSRVISGRKVGVAG